jgi:hypothetical protein
VNVVPDWQARIIAYRIGSQWLTPEAVQFERAKALAYRDTVFDDALPYTFEMLMRRHANGDDVPAWTVMHVDAEIRLRRVA